LSFLALFAFAQYVKSGNSWIRTRYRPVRQLGERPLENEGFGIMVMEKIR